MPRITPANQLYLYDLLRREVGIGKQTMITRVEEVLVSDDILPCDLDCNDVRELLEHMSDWVRLTVFKKGRVYATVQQKPEWDDLLAQAKEADKGKGSGPASSGRGGAKSWKRKKSAKMLRPAKPRPHGRPKVIVEEEASQEKTLPAEVTPDAVTTAEKEPKAEVSVPEPPVKLEDVIPSVEAVPENAPAVEVVPEAAPVEEAVESEATTSEPQVETMGEVIETEEEHVEPEAEPVPLPKAEPTPTPSDTPQPEPAAASEPLDVPQPDPTPALPQHLAREALCTNETLAALYQLLPLDVDPIALADEDWRVARSTGAYEGDRRSVTFDLRCLATAQGSPVRVCLQRIAPTATGRRWELTVATPVSELESSSLEGQPHACESIWHDLDFAYDAIRAYRLANPLRELAQFAVLGPWEELLQQLANLAEPESWGADLEYLREYLVDTFARIQSEDKILTWENETRAAFDTGLLSARAEHVLMTFVACEGDIPWKFVGFCTQLEPAPANAADPDPATYVKSLADITLAAPCDVRVPRMLEEAYGPSLTEAIRHSCLRARRNYRLATPAYDPHTDALRLLLPLSLREADAVTHALVLDPQAEGAYAARAVVSLERARACARVVTSELPRWLTS